MCVDSVPVVSVIMGVYERADNVNLLEKSIQSVLQQTMKDFEFLICDDGSDKIVQDLIDKYAKCDSRIVILRNYQSFSTLAERI